MKENEWVVSPKKLRENQERSIERDLEIKQQKHDKKALIIIGIISLGLLAFMIHTVCEMSNDFMNQCTRVNSVEFCARAMDGR